jgi:myeloid leukemia factor 1
MQNDPNGHSFMHSSVMTYTNDGSGQPKIYQATTSTRQAPGGVCLGIFQIALEAS